VALTFSSAFGGSKNIYGYASTRGGLTSGWPKLGIWTVPGAQPPETLSVIPSSGTGSSQTFSFLYSVPNAASELADVQAVFNTAVNGAGACYFRADPQHNQLWLANDNVSAWLGPILLGSANTLQNSQCAVSGAGSSGIISGDIFTLTVSLAFGLPSAAPEITTLIPQQ
jgi:hypothetical protein